MVVDERGRTSYSIAGIGTGRIRLATAKKGIPAQSAVFALGVEGRTTDFFGGQNEYDFVFQAYAGKCLEEFLQCLGAVAAGQQTGELRTL